MAFGTGGLGNTITGMLARDTCCCYEAALTQTDTQTGHYEPLCPNSSKSTQQHFYKKRAHVTACSEREHLGAPSPRCAAVMEKDLAGQRLRYEAKAHPCTRAPSHPASKCLRSCSTPPLAGNACLCLRAGRKQRVPALLLQHIECLCNWVTATRPSAQLCCTTAGTALLRGAGRSQHQPAASLHSQVPEHSRAVSGLPSPWAAHSVRVHVWIHTASMLSKLPSHLVFPVRFAQLFGKWWCLHMLHLWEHLFQKISITGTGSVRYVTNALSDFSSCQI